MALRLGALLFAATMTLSCTGRDELPLVLLVGNPSISRLPYVIAYDQGLYEKYGLDVELRIREPGPGGAIVRHTDIVTNILRGLGIVDVPPHDIMFNGIGPVFVQATQTVQVNPYSVAIASTDCVLRAHVIGRMGVTSLEQLKGGRLGASSLGATSGTHALVLAQRMGWDPVDDISIMEGADDDIGLLRNNSLDAIIGYETAYAQALEEGYPILADTREWNEILAGNSARVRRGWLNNDANREAARRFLKATVEGIALFHQRPEIAMQVMEDWYGFEDREFARNYYSRGAWIPRKPYPCHEGLRRTAEIYDSLAMRQLIPETFFDDSFVRELDESGFIDDLYN
jgi:ABC-type nitrate/sulfonate/bicarbonate transport system substrate-binding protein